MNSVYQDLILLNKAFTLSYSNRISYSRLDLLSFSFAPADPGGDGVFDQESEPYIRLDSHDLLVVDVVNWSTNPDFEDGSNKGDGTRYLSNPSSLHPPCCLMQGQLCSNISAYQLFGLPYSQCLGMDLYPLVACMTLDISQTISSLVLKFVFSYYQTANYQTNC